MFGSDCLVKPLDIQSAYEEIKVAIMKLTSNQLIEFVIYK